MSGVLLDTHAWAWTMAGDARLSPEALRFIARADRVLVSPISCFEIGQKVRIGKWPEMMPFLERLPELLVEQGGQSARLDPAICLRAATLDWAHRDPFDRFIAATAMEEQLPLISADTVFDTLAGHPGWTHRVW
ncbi:type II toxin-antitoxin system VapC family toxin [Xanthobacteraceae bacterium A53D]